jgi:hypothetical protein
VPGAVLLIIAMAVVFPPLVFGGGLVVSALIGLFTGSEEPAEPLSEQTSG